MTQAGRGARSIASRIMRILRRLAVIVTACAAFVALPAAAQAAAKPTVVLVHGAFADASSLRALYDELAGEGLPMIAPPNPLRGLTGGDGEHLKGVIGEIDGPVLLVGHSYGGSVITAAGTADNVVGLVYISGFAPDEGENLTDLQSKFTASGIIPYIV